MDFNEFFATIYEMFLRYYDPSFSGDLYDEELYTVLGTGTILINLVLVLLFYYGINRPNFSRWYNWLLMLIVGVSTSFVFSYFLIYNKFEGLGYLYETIQYISFSIRNAIFSVVLFIIFTYLFKWWSTNAKGTPKLFVKF